MALAMAVRAQHLNAVGDDHRQLGQMVQRCRSMTALSHPLQTWVQAPQIYFVAAMGAILMDTNVMLRSRCLYLRAVRARICDGVACSGVLLL